jgi:WD40 repeat protein
MYFMRLVKNRSAKIGLLTALPIVLFLIIADVLYWRPKTISNVGSVAALSFSADGSVIQCETWPGSYSTRRPVDLWDIQSKTLIKQVRGAPYKEDAIEVKENKSLHSVSRDGDIKATGTLGNNTAYLVVESTRGVKQSIESPSSIWSLALSPDGTMLATGGADDIIRVWDVESGKLMRIIAAHSGKVTSLAFSPDDYTLASGSYDKTIKLWHVKRRALWFIANQ